MKWFLLALGLGVGLSTLQREVRLFEQGAAKDIAARLQGEQKSVKVQVRLEGVLEGSQGRLRSARIEARDFHVEGLPLFTERDRPQNGFIGVLELRLYDFSLRALAIKELGADLFQCRYDFGLAKRERRVRLSHSGTGPGYALVTEEALERFLLSKYPEIKSVSVRLKKYKAFVEGYGEFLIAQSRFYVIADLQARQGTQIWLSNAIVFLDGKRASPEMERALLNVINPVLDLDKDLGLYGALQLSRVDIQEGMLVARGIARIPERPEEMPPPPTEKNPRKKTSLSSYAKEVPLKGISSRYTSSSTLFKE